MARKSSGSILWRVILIFLVVLVVLVLLIELGLRMFLSNQLTSGFEEQAQEQGLSVEEEPEVSFGSTPIVAGLLTGELPRVSMNTPSTLQTQGDTFVGTPAADIDIEALTLSDTPVAGTLRTTTELPEDYMLSIIREQLRSQVEEQTQGSDIATSLIDELGITGLSANVEQQTIDLQFAQGLAGISLAPLNVNGQMGLEARSTELFGMSLPSEVSSSITAALQDGISEQARQHAGPGTVESMTIEDYEVVPGALWVTVVGNDVPISEM